MKKFSIFFVALAFVGLVGFAPSVQAASASDVRVLGAQTASLLDQTLEAMQSLLNLIQLRTQDTVNPLTDSQKVALNGVLGGMETNLAGINATIASLKQQASAGNVNYAPVVVNKPANTVVVNPTPDAPIIGIAPDGTVSPVIADGIEEKDTRDDEVAAVGVSSRMKGVLWGLLGLFVLIVAGILFLRPQDEVEQNVVGEKKEAPVAPAAEVAVAYEMGKVDAVNEVLAQSPTEEAPAQVENNTAPLPMA